MINLVKIKQYASGVLFPVFCVVCGQEGEWWCASCQAKEPARLQNFCNQCSAPLKLWATCSHCDRIPKFGVTALFDYQSSRAASKLIKLYKYNHARSIRAVWEKIIAPLEIKSLGRAVVIPVPLFPRRARSRGFNLAADLAEIFAQKMDLEINGVDLQRVRATKQQTKLGKEERAVNMRGAFAYSKNKPAPEQVILVDDVFTTGATLRACAAALQAAGTQELWSLVLARD
ncbi:MAG: phosphoribosyltransferase family protein [Candidatus Magasanikbacteria bacterium]|nr:phosphoribosyltransferase family protein [Candidatus Magasanikbacteria bacterium]